MKKALALFFVLALVLSSLAVSGAEEGTVSYPWSDETILDSSLLPTWEGKQLELTWWYGHGVDAMPPEVSTMDVVEPEIERVTGVKINYDESFSNGVGTTFDVRLAMLAGTKDWPSIVTEPQLTSTLIEGGVVYDLTDLIPKYMPNLMKIAPMDDSLAGNIWKSAQLTGGTDRVYAIPTVHIPFELIKDQFGFDTESEAKFRSVFALPVNFRGKYIRIRDDVLKMLFPEAKTQDEIDALYMEKGYFDYEDIFDVPIKSIDDFFDLLVKIDELNLTEGGQKVYATYAACGLDNYPMGARLASILYGWGASRDNFTYWDNVEKKIKFAGYEEELRDIYRRFNRLIRDDVVSAESLIDDNVTWQSKMNNGLYAISYAEYTKADDAIIEATKDFRYRWLYIDIPIDQERYVQSIEGPKSSMNMMIFKDAVAEEDLPQILMWADYHYSKAYDNLRYWGPSSAGLYEETEDGRRFLDKDLEDAMLYNNNPDLLEKYALVNGMTNVNYKTRRLTPAFGGTLTGAIYSPYMQYSDVKRDVGQTDVYFSSGMVDGITPVITNLGWIWNFSNAVPGVEKMWAARTTWEDALMKTLAAQSDEEFERLFDDFISISHQLGMTDETLDECTEYFVNEYNAPYMDMLNG